MRKTFLPGSALLLATALAALCRNWPGNSTQSAPSGTEEQIGARHILIMYQGSESAPARVTRTKDEAKALAEELLEKLKQGGNFENLATDYSDCTSATSGGDLGTFGRNAMVAPFEEAAFACKVGEITGIVETPFGYHIIYRYQ